MTMSTGTTVHASSICGAPVDLRRLGPVVAAPAPVAHDAHNAARPATTMKITAVMPSTKNATSRMAKAGVETGEKMLGVGTRSAARATAAIAANPSAISPAEAARIITRKL